MRNKIFGLFFILYYSFSVAQREANIWYFGKNAGLDFNSGVPVPLTDGQMSTFEGCATISNAAGQLLFYTDGVTVWNKMHQVMTNGSGLLGHSSSTQSATVVQKPGSLNLFYIFTTDNEHDPDGFRYSIVDLSLDNGNGAITSDKNILIRTPVIESLGVTKHANGSDFWILTHGWENNTFYAYQLSSSGLSASPVTTSIGAVIQGVGFQAASFIKISPSGSKLAFTSVADVAQLFDFNIGTGVLSNPITLSTEGGELYGVEFSPTENVLYVTNALARKVYQYNLTAADIRGSEITIYNSEKYPGALQLGPDGKIYLAVYSQNKIGVINNPNVIGTGCDLQIAGIDLGGKISNGGLPSFNQSFFFTPFIELSNSCVNQPVTLKLNTNLNITTAIWNFGDGNGSNEINPSHTYTAPGTYTISVTAATALGTGTNTRDIVISEIPSATKPQDIFICDNDNDGYYSFDLTAQNSAILNGQDPNLYSVNYLANNVIIPLPEKYTNNLAYQQEVITAEVSNKANSTCKNSTTFAIDVFDTPKPASPSNIPDLTSCDNTSIGTDSDGKVIFDLTQRATAILNGQSPSQFILSYYKDTALTQGIVQPNTYQNATSDETIFVKIVNKDNVSCTAVTSFKLKVFSLPVIAGAVDLKQCDDNIDGFSIFNLEEAINKITANSANEIITFHKTLPDAQNNSNPILNYSAYTNQIVSVDKVYVRIANINNCFRIAQLNLIVSTTQIPSTYSKTFTQCDDEVLGTNKDGISEFDFSTVTNDIKNIFPSGQLLDITYYQNISDALAEKNAISDISGYRNTSSPHSQQIFIRVDSRLNNDCLGLGGYITLKVESIPVVKAIERIHCDDNHDGLFAFNTLGLEQELLNGLSNVTVSYMDQNNNPLPSPLPNPFVTASQTVKVTVKNNTPTACSYNSTIKFVVDDLPKVFAIDPALTTVCDDEEDPILQDGKYAFDTSSFQTTLLGNQSGMVVNYYDSNNNLLSSPLPNPFITNSQEIKVEIVNPKNLGCSAISTLAFVVNPAPNIMLIGEELVCSNLPTFTKQIDAGLLDLSTINDYNYQWSRNDIPISGEKNYSLTVNEEGVYKVDVSNKQTQCIRTRTIKVSASDIASNIITTVSESNTISVSVIGNGDYVYVLDDQNGDYQAGNTFYNVPSGIHTVYVKDQNGCGTVLKEVAVFGIPAFFTPNNDNHNDYWNIEGVNAASNGKSIIQIFDRYGKLLKQIDPLSQGWDGYYLGSQMPADDYWYVIKLEDSRIFKGHFALKR
ncbi:T9SS type B sorting domain-containing protein [Flavobacterium hibisci]|uniref:T9SS type B sorting domain-containing protein n=1 Tax=Flavobacterium hibisci TaxID=1914462 RepID=UPI001CC029D1|nr:T9SS type B sorting domain-containing protein [Flavobacterium hibisci]MBZ4042493.1 T9SS type B sorting domain-containing protein [Flavobacterium hibisci]